MKVVHAPYCQNWNVIDFPLFLANPTFLDLLYGEHHKQDTMIDSDDLNEDDLFKSINETLLEIEELGINHSSEILSS